MHNEIAQAVEFLGRLLDSKMERSDIEAFQKTLSQSLLQRFANHWDPQQPYRGNAFRAITALSGRLDTVLTHAAERASIPPAKIHAHFPPDFVLWIDPFSVSYRVGDHGNIMTLFEDRSHGRASTVDIPTPTFYQRPRPHQAIRITPPSSPENVKLKNQTHQPAPLTTQVKEGKVSEQVSPKQQQPQTKHQRKQLVMAN